MCYCFLISFFLGIALGVLLMLILRLRKHKISISETFEKSVFWIQRLWYSFILLMVTLFVCFNYDDCINLRFTSDFNGKNLVFLFWLLLLIFPLFDSFEGFGIKFKNMMNARQMNKDYEALKKAQEAIEQVNDKSEKL